MLSLAARVSFLWGNSTFSILNKGVGTNGFSLDIADLVSRCSRVYHLVRMDKEHMGVGQPSCLRLNRS